jgi:hypothetical protein
MHPSIIYASANSKSRAQATAVSVPLLVVLVLWLTVIFMSFGLFGPFEPLVVTSLVVSALWFRAQSS